MTIFEGTVLFNIVTDILTRKGYCPLPTQDLNSRESMLYHILPVHEYMDIMEKSYQVIGCENPW